MLPILGFIGLLAFAPTIVHLIQSGLQKRHRRK
jgi:hypothetical protein